MLLSPFGEKLFYGDNRDLFTVHLSDGTLWTFNRSLEEHITVFGSGISENSLRKENGYKPRGDVLMKTRDFFSVLILLSSIFLLCCKNSRIDSEPMEIEYYYYNNSMNDVYSYRINYNNLDLLKIVKNKMEITVSKRNEEKLKRQCKKIFNYFENRDATESPLYVNDFVNIFIIRIGNKTYNIQSLDLKFRKIYPEDIDCRQLIKLDKLVREL